MTNQAITILMPVYNGALYLKEAIDSILIQTYENFEFLIINDGSSDNSEEIIKSYTDKRIRLINQKNAGVSAALNLGVQLASNNYIARMDADDVCLPTRIEEQMDFMLKNPQYILVGSDVDYIDKEGNFIFHYTNTGHTNEEINERINWICCPFLHSAIIYKRDAVIKAGGYDINAYLFEDHFLWIRLIKMGKVANLKKPLIKVRLNPSSVTIDQRDCSVEYLKIKNKAIQTGELTNEEGELLKKNVTKISAQQKTFSYYSLLGKKYLWNNYQPEKARKNLIQAIKTSPLNIRAYIILLLSFLPKGIIKIIYSLTKGKNEG